MISSLSKYALRRSKLSGPWDIQAGSAEGSPRRPGCKLCSWGNVHELQPRPHREALVKGEPYEGAHFLGPGVMPYPGNGLVSGCVPQVEASNEGNHMRRAHKALGVDVTSLRCVSE